MKTFSLIIMILGFVLLLALEAIGQPTLPTGPDQAPLDGGLGLVAVAGGAYAWKKLKSKNK